MSNIDIRSQAPEGARCKCDNCGWNGTVDQTTELVDVQERLDPGSEVPVGDCPECRAFCYLIKPLAKKKREVYGDRLAKQKAVLLKELAQLGCDAVAPHHKHVSGMIKLGTRHWMLVKLFPACTRSDNRIAVTIHYPIEGLSHISHGVRTLAGIIQKAFGGE